MVSLPLSAANLARHYKWATLDFAASFRVLRSQRASKPLVLLNASRPGADMSQSVVCRACYMVVKASLRDGQRQIEPSLRAGPILQLGTYFCASLSAATLLEFVRRFGPPDNSSSLEQPVKETTTTILERL